jgi:DNA-binding transcriptional LysR family regulator
LADGSVVSRPQVHKTAAESFAVRNGDRAAQHRDECGDRLPGSVDDALASLGLARRVVLTVAHASAAPMVAARTDFVATLNERLARAMAPGLGLVLVPLTFLSRGETVVMAWHPRHATDAAHAWLRRQVPAAIVAAGAVAGQPVATAAP